MNKPSRYLGYWCAGGTLLLIALVSYWSGSLTALIIELPRLFSSQYQLITIKDFSLLSMALYLCAAITLTIPLAYLGQAIQSIILGKAKGAHVLTQAPDLPPGFELPPAQIFLIFFVWVIGEELFARWLFLGILTKVLPGPVGFVILFLLGNGLWAIVHKYNYLDKSDQKNLRVLPQFLGGIILTFIFLKFGLLASVLAHFGHNAIIFATYKKDQFKVWHLYLVAYYLLLVVISFSLITQDLSQVTSWFNSQPVFVLAGWGFWDYVIFDIFIMSLINCLVLLLAYDGLGTTKLAMQKASTNLESQSNLWRRNKLLGLLNAMSLPIILSITQMIMTYLLYWLSGFITDNVPFRILTLTLLVCFLQQRLSTNAMAKDFWTTLPSLYIMISIIQGLHDIWPIFCYILIRTMLSLPATFIFLNRSFHDYNHELIKTPIQET